MNKLQDLLTFSYLKILNYFSFKIKYLTPSYAVFTHPSDRTRYYLFNEPDREYFTLFSTALPGVVSKEELLFELTKGEKIPALVTLIPVIQASQPTDVNPVFSLTMTPESIAPISLELGELPDEEGAWYQTPIFKKRIFKSKSGGFMVPLCIYEDRRFVQFVNTVEWDGGKQKFLNERVDGFFSSNLLGSSVKTFITSMPWHWEQFGQRSDADQYFFLLAHPQSGPQVFSTLFGLHQKQCFSSISFPIGRSVSDLNFIGRALSYLNAVSSSTLQMNFLFSEERLAVMIAAFAKPEVMKITAFITELKRRSEKELFGIAKDNYSIQTGTLKAQLPEVNRGFEKNCTFYTISQSLDPGMIVITLTTLCTYLLPGYRLEFHSLE